MQKDGGDGGRPWSSILNPADDVSLDPGVVAALYVEHADELRRFLVGVLRDADLAHEAAQCAFAKAVEVGHTAREASFKGWLFRVAFNEALAIKRREVVKGKVMRRLAWVCPQSGPAPDEQLSRYETVANVREALEFLPAEQKQVVRMRIYEEKTFAVIAAELGVPLGTVLSRMQLALRKLRIRLDNEKK